MNEHAPGRISAGTLTLLVALGSGCERPSPNPAPGVAIDLAQERARTLSDLRYDLRLWIPDSTGERIHGRETMDVVRSPGAGPLVLDFAAPEGSLLAARIDGDSLPFRRVNQHIVIPSDALSPGSNQIELDFLAGDLSLNRNADYLYTLFVPDRARFAFPCFDQPDLKARFTLTLDLPAGWKAVANGKLDEVTRREATHGEAGSTYRFAETKPIPTYLFAFVAGDWKVETGERGGRTFHMFHRETDEAKVARNRDTIFDLQAHALDWLEDYTGIPFPFDKFDFVAVPSFQYGGMEHPGAVLYRADGILLDESATQSDRLGQASVIAHETSHMWFGDLVTMKWFNDVWMKEVFANFMAAKIVNPSFPGINHDLRFLLRHYPAAYAVDRTAGANPIRQELDNLQDAGTLYGAIIYEKAPIVMRQLEALIGAEAMRAGLREYLGDHVYGNATWPDLIDVLDRRSPEDLKAWSHVWVDEPGRPRIETRLTLDGDGRIERLALAQSDPWKQGRVWPERLHVLVAYADTTRVFLVRIEDTLLTIPEAAGLPAPDFVLPNGRGLGYGDFVLDTISRRYLLEHLPAFTNPLVRAAAWVDLWEAMLDERVTADDMADLALRALPRETEELTVERILGELGEAYWRYLGDSARAALAPRVETRLWTGMEGAGTTSLKSAYFNAYRSLALTPAGVERLRSVWQKQTTIEGLPLSERDYTALALALAVRSIPDQKAILDAQHDRIENPDRKARFEFVRPAASADPAVRDSFFESLRDPRNREHEPWVLTGLRLLHHPLRAASAEKYVRPALEMLEEIQRTGDIFFPKRWLDATFSGHGSPAVAETVCEFLRARPEYPARLRAKILQSADPLLRAARLRHPELTTTCG